jgi:signal transduction histidine kinase
MSHELRTPMNGIQGMAQMLMMKGIDEAERIEFARTIYNSGASLLVLLKDVLDYAEMGSGQMKPERQEYFPVALLEKIVGLNYSAAQAKNLTLKTASALPPEKKYWGDPLRLEQILTHLASNAIKFTEAGWIEFGVDEVHGNRETTLRFTVTDTGIGIANDRQADLFQPFAQLDNSPTRRYGGTGLGLAICMSLVELMDGRIGLSNHASQGSVFWFEIP